MTPNPQYLGLVDQVYWLIEASKFQKNRINYIETILAEGGSNSQPLNQIVVGSGTGITSFSDFNYSNIAGGTEGLNVGVLGVKLLEINTKRQAIGDIDGNMTPGAKFYTSTTSPISFISGFTTKFGDYVELTENYARLGDIDNNLSTTYLEEDYVNSVAIQTNAIATPTMQVDNGSGTLTINDGVRGLYYDPPSLVASCTITLSSSPVDGQEIVISFGGQLTGNNIVCTSTTILPNSGQHMLKNPVSSLSTNTGDTYIFKYRTSNTTWYCMSSY